MKVSWISCRIAVDDKAGSGTKDRLFLGIMGGEGEEWSLGDQGYETGKSYRFLIGSAPDPIAKDPNRPNEIVVRLGRIRRVKDYVQGVGRNIYLRKHEGTSDTDDDSLLLKDVEVEVHSEPTDTPHAMHVAFLGGYRLSRAVGEWVWLGEGQYNS